MQLDYLEKNPKINLVHCNEKWIKAGIEIGQKKYHNRNSEDLFERSLRRCLISPSSVLLRKEIFKSVGIFDETLPACEDYDLWLRILINEKVGYIEEQLVTKHGGHTNQLSRQTRYLDLYRLKSLFKLIKSPGLSSLKKIQIQKEINYKSKIILSGARKHKNLYVLNQYNQIRSNVL